MKKIYFSIASCLMLFGGFSQINGLKNQSQTNQNITISQAPAKVGQAVIKNSGSNLTSGHTCKSHELTEQYYQEQGTLNQFNQDYMNAATQARYNTNQTRTSGNTIAVIFHVVHEGESIGTGTNVSNAAIMSVYNDLVEDFSLTNADRTNARSGFGFVPANAGINFCLATQDENGNPISETGVIRTSTSKTWFDSDDPTEVNAMKSSTFGSQIWDRSKYLNVWICDITNGASSGTAGYAYRPSTGSLPGVGIDGIVIDYNIGVNNDNILTHEVGHYLGLDHTWGGSGSCSSDDGFSDTPNTNGPSFNDPSTSCSGNQVNCTGVQTQYENYMDYSNCTVMFTTEQSTYMNSILSGIRGSLLLSSGCNPAGPPVSAFSSNPTTPVIPVNGTVNYFDESSASPTSWNWTFSGTQGVDWDFINSTTANSENPQVIYYNTGFYNVSLTASNGFGAGTPVTSNSYVQVVAQATGISCDTLRNYDPSTESGTAYNNSYGGGWGDWGYLPGHGAYDNAATAADPDDLFNLEGYAERYTSPTTSEVRRIRIPILYAEDPTGAGTITVNVHSDGAGIPGAITGTEVVNIADLNPSGNFNEIDFTTPVSVTGAFWVSLGLNYTGTPATQDTVVFAQVDVTERTANGGVNTMFYGLAGSWYDLSGSYGATSLYMDVLLSNGAAPTAVIDMPINEVCVGGDIAVDGSGSTNVTDYFWIQANEPYTGALATNQNSATSFNFGGPAGDYAIYLIADGSCQSDVLGYVVSVYDAVSATPVPTATTCNNDNGVITFNSPAGGDGVNYEYSLDGTNYQASNVFNNLATGSYTGYVRTLGNSCETSYSVTVGTTASPIGAATASAAICPSGSTTLTASGTGATGFAWYDGATLLGNSATQLVSPSTTTQYTVEISFPGGCVDVQYSNVTVNPLDDASFDFFDFCVNSPNAAANIGETGGTFSLTVNPNGATINPTTGEISSETLGSTYTVQYALNNTCANSSTQDVSVSAADDVSFTTSDYCAGSAHSVTGIGTTGGTFTYGTPGDGSSINASTGVITGGVAGATYNMVYATTGVCAATSAATPVTVKLTPSVDAGSPQTVCSDEDVTLTATNPNSAAISWNNSVVDGVAFSPTLGTTSYTVTATLSGCTSTDFVNIIANQSPAVNAGTNLSVCEGDDVTLTASNPNSAVLSWNNGVTNGMAFTPTVGTTTYTATATLGSCVTTSDVMVEVNIVPSTYAGMDQTVCAGEDVTLTATNPDAATITWSNNVVDGVVFNPTAGNVIYVATATLGACSFQDQVTVDAIVSPVVIDTLITHDSGTGNGAIDVTITGGTITSTTWSNASTEEDLTGLDAGMYTITIENSNSCTTVETYTVLSTVGISDQVSIEKNLTIYPNPSSGLFNIQLEGEFTYSVVDLRGRTILSDSNSNNAEVDLTNNEAGIYFLRIQMDGDLVVKKLVIK